MIQLRLAQRMRELRLKNKYTQKAVASALHIERQTYCNYELGLRIPPFETVLHLADFYQISLDDLCQRDFPSSSSVND